MRWASAVFFLCLVTTTYAQDTIPESKRVQAFPVPAIGKSIETGWYFGAVCLFKFSHLFKTNKYSTGKAEFNYTLNRQVIANTSWFLYTGNNRHIIIGDQSYLYFPEYYYGIGNQTPASGELYYTANRLELYNSLLWKVNSPLYLGVSLKAQRVWSLNPQVGLNDEVRNELVINNAGWSVGAGAHLMADKRDRILNPSAGSFFLDIENITYRKENITRQTRVFSSIKTDLRVYRKLFNRSVVAFQLYSLNTFGHAPYRLMGLLGSDSHMRGYYQGRYRDDHYLTVQAEARIRLNNWFGVTAFTGLGDVFSGPSDVTVNTVKYSVGGGVRVLVDKNDRINLRLDYAIGKETSGFYVAFGEAF